MTGFPLPSALYVAIFPACFAADQLISWLLKAHRVVHVVVKLNRLD